MGAIYRLLLFLHRLLSGLSKPLDRPLRRLLQLWALLRRYLSSRSDPPTSQRKIERSIVPGDRNDVVICASNVPTYLAPSISHDTPTLFSPIPIHVTRHLSPYELSTSITSNSLHNLTDDGDMDGQGSTNNLQTYDYTHGRPRASSRASSRAPSSFRNSHMGAEESAMRTLRPRSLVIPSRSASPASQRSPMVYNLHMGAEETAFQNLEHHNHLNLSPASTRSRFPAKNLFTTNLKARSMVDLHPRNYPAPKSRSPSRTRSPSAKPASRARSRAQRPIASSGYIPERSLTPKVDPSPGHVAADPHPSSESIGDDLPEIIPCATVARYDRNIRM
jgi:hypothetical protein